MSAGVGRHRDEGGLLVRSVLGRCRTAVRWVDVRRIKTSTLSARRTKLEILRRDEQVSDMG